MFTVRTAEDSLYQIQTPLLLVLLRCHFELNYCRLSIFLSFYSNEELRKFHKHIGNHVYKQNYRPSILQLCNNY